MADRVVTHVARDTDGDVLSIANPESTWFQRRREWAIQDIHSGRHRYLIPPARPTRSVDRGGARPVRALPALVPRRRIRQQPRQPARRPPHGRFLASPDNGVCGWYDPGSGLVDPATIAPSGTPRPTTPPCCAAAAGRRVHAAGADGRPGRVAPDHLGHLRPGQPAGLFTGGIDSAETAGLPDTAAVLEGEVYDPGIDWSSAAYGAADSWTTTTRATVPRNYHSVALLLPNGLVLTAGSNLDGQSGGDRRRGRTTRPVPALGGRQRRKAVQAGYLRSGRLSLRCKCAAGHRAHIPTTASEPSHPMHLLSYVHVDPAHPPVAG